MPVVTQICDLPKLALHAEIRAPSYRRGEGHVAPSSDLYVVKVKGD